MKRWIISFIILCVLISMAVPAAAAMEEGLWEYIETEQDLVIWVSWDVEQPTVVFIAPDGTEYDPTQESDSTTAFVSTSTLYYSIKNAPAGQWRMRYDKLSNTELEIELQSAVSPLRIDSFSMGEPLDSRTDVTFLVSGQDEQSYNYRISAVIDHTGAEKELYTGYGIAGAEETVEVRLDGLSSYSAYMLKLYVWYNDGSADIFDFVYSDSFAYTNEETDQRFSDFELSVAPADGLVYVTVPDISWLADSVMVAIFENGGAEPAMFDEYTPEELDNLQLAYDPAATEVAVEVAVSYDGIFSAPVRKTFKPNRSAITLPDTDAINSLILPMSYSDMDRQSVDVEINGTHNGLVLEGSGSVNLTLGDDWNTVIVSYTDSAGIDWLLEREIFVDRVPPVLTMSQSYDGMTAKSDKLTLSGTVTDYYQLTVNGQAVTPDQGMFSQELSLSTGANTVEVVASDKLGNEARYTAVIYYGVDSQEWEQSQENQSAPGGLLELVAGPGSYWILIIVGVLCLMVIGYALIFWRKEGKK